MKLRHLVDFEWSYFWEAVRERWARTLCAVFGHPPERVEKMWCSLCVRCSKVVEEKPRQMVLPAQRLDGAATTHTTLPSSKELATLDEMLAKMRELIHQHRGHPERTQSIEAELERASTLRAVLAPLPAMRVERSDFLDPDASFNIDGSLVLGRFAWSRLMRVLGAPWPEEMLTPDADFPRDAPPT